MFSLAIEHASRDFTLQFWARQNNPIVLQSYSAITAMSTVVINVFLRSAVAFSVILYKTVFHTFHSCVVRTASLQAIFFASHSIDTVKTLRINIITMAQKMTSRCANKTPVHDDELANVMSQLRLEGASKGPRLSSAQMLPQDQFKHKDTIREETNFNDGLDTFEGKTWHELQQWKGFRPSKVTITKGGIRQFSFQNPNFKGNDKTLNDEEMTALCNEFLAMNKRKKNEHAIKNLAKKHGLTRYSTSSFNPCCHQIPHGAAV